jgi:hypothetical protein
VRVGLVADVPDQAIGRGIEHIVQCDCQFDDAEAGRQMPARLGHGIDEETPHLGRQQRQLGRGEASQIVRRVNLIQQIEGGTAVLLHPKSSTGLRCYSIAVAARQSVALRTPAASTALQTFENITVQSLF